MLERVRRAAFASKIACYLHAVGSPLIEHVHVDLHVSGCSGLHESDQLADHILRAESRGVGIDRWLGMLHGGRFVRYAQPKPHERIRAAQLYGGGAERLRVDGRMQRSY